MIFVWVFEEFRNLVSDHKQLTGACVVDYLDYRRGGRAVEWMGWGPIRNWWGRRRVTYTTQCATSWICLIGNSERDSCGGIIITRPLPTVDLWCTCQPWSFHSQCHPGISRCVLVIDGCRLLLIWFYFWEIRKENVQWWQPSQPQLFLLAQLRYKV